MARCKIQIDDALKKVICTRYDEGMDRKEILRHLIDRYHFRISLSVLKRYLKAWGKARYKVISSLCESKRNRSHDLGGHGVTRPSHITKTAPTIEVRDGIETKT